MQYEIDSSNNQFLIVDVGWPPDANLRLTYITNEHSIRINKFDSHIFPGPEIEIKYIPALIEQLEMMYNDKKGET